MIRPVVGKRFDHSGVPARTQADLQIYPNPTHDILHVETADNQDNLSYQVYDIYGKLLQSGSILSNTIRLGDYADGLYFVRILQNNQIITTEKIVKK